MAVNQVSRVKFLQGIDEAYYHFISGINIVEIKKNFVADNYFVTLPDLAAIYAFLLNGNNDQGYVAYIGQTHNLKTRVYQHKNNTNSLSVLHFSNFHSLIYLNARSYESCYKPFGLKTFLRLLEYKLIVYYQPQFNDTITLLSR